jgi:hypothetical protein
VSRILTKLLQTADFFRDSFTKEQLLLLLTIGTTVLFVVAAAYYLSYIL